MNRNIVVLLQNRMLVFPHMDVLTNTKTWGSAALPLWCVWGQQPLPRVYNSSGMSRCIDICAVHMYRQSAKTRNNARLWSNAWASSRVLLFKRLLVLNFHAANGGVLFQFRQLHDSSQIIYQEKILWWTASHNGTFCLPTNAARCTQARLIRDG